MRCSRIFLPLSLVTLFVVPVLTYGDEITDLKAAFAAEIGALNARDLETLMGKQHEQIIALSPTSPSPIDGKAARRQGYQQLFETMESLTVTPHNPQYRVVGDTGVVWGTYTIESKPKGGPVTTTSVRFSRTYIKTNGQWQLFVYHVSPMPAGNKGARESPKLPGARAAGGA
ncbi:MAG TPA: nuclear transport factor 2 family protein [Candidatus Binatia bacterium]|jgi:ketosteroid isomerase-like protein|nr:nuclear transport factor 2 family protein [Candidatus Binatia bacterium]